MAQIILKNKFLMNSVHAVLHKTIICDN